jgi:hypothetical protein
MPKVTLRRGRISLSEAQIQRQCIEYLRAGGWIVRPAPKQGHRTGGAAYEIPAGEPDLIAVRAMLHGDGEYHHQVLLVECKTEVGIVSPEQKSWARWALSKHGMKVHVVRSLDDLKEILL